MLEHIQEFDELETERAKAIERSHVEVVEMQHLKISPRKKSAVQTASHVTSIEVWSADPHYESLGY